MEKRGLLFLDYNGTFDDVSGRRSTIFIDGLTEYINFYSGNVDICVITSAWHSDNPEISITGDLVTSLYQLPKLVRERFTFLIENNCQNISAIDHREGLQFRLLNPVPFPRGEKKDGVERLVRMIDKEKEIQTCVFAGDMKTDAKMLDAEVGEREKLFIFAKKSLLKEFDPSVPRYKLSLNPEKYGFDFGREIETELKDGKKLFIRTSTQCFGVGKGLSAVVSYLKHKTSLAKTQNPQTKTK